MAFPITQPEIMQQSLQFALLLRDAFADSAQLLGGVGVSCQGVQGQRKDSSGTFLFNGLTPGALVFAVSSDPGTPYYQPLIVPVALPMPSALWPAFPDRTAADPNLPLGDPGQAAAYRAQRQQATLLPTTGYPFPPGATLIRGTVRHGGQPLPAATVQQVGGTDPSFTTGADGQFVLYVSNAPGLAQQVTVKAQCAGLPDQSVNVTLTRGLTVTTNIDM